MNSPHNISLRPARPADHPSWPACPPQTLFFFSGPVRSVMTDIPAVQGLLYVRLIRDYIGTGNRRFSPRFGTLRIFPSPPSLLGTRSGPAWSDSGLFYAVACFLNFEGSFFGNSTVHSLRSALCQTPTPKTQSAVAVLFFWVGHRFLRARSGSQEDLE